MKTKSAKPGKRISVEVTNISKHGFWLLLGKMEHFVPFEQFPWFRKAAIVDVLNAEVSWELIENLDFVIEHYRTATAAIGYTGDTAVNSVGDLLCCAVGFVVARKLGLRQTVALFAAIELILLVWIRDSLLLNIMMLFYPIDAIKLWQLGQ